MKHLDREHRIYVLDPDNVPAITIDSGEELMVETWDAFEGIRDPAVIGARHLRGPATGPSTLTAPSLGMPLRWNSSASPPRKGQYTW